MSNGAAPRSIIIIGGGFAGTVTAIKLLDRARAPLAITIIERRVELGRGVAYGTTDPVHLLNGPARIFGLHPDRPDHLVDWLRQHGAAHGWAVPDDIHESSAPRWLYGSYLQSELERAQREAGGRASFRHVQGSAISIRQIDGRAEVKLDGGETLVANRVVLALGVFQSALRPQEAAIADHPRFVRDPWDRAAIDRLTNAREVLLIGSSLSMVDVVASLESRGYAGCYQVVSRRGQFIEPRRTTEVWPSFLVPGSFPTTAKALLAAVKAERRAISAIGEDWQRLPLAIRPHVLALWQGADAAEQRRFARHLRAFWDVALHRAAPPSGAVVDNVIREGRLTRGAGRVTSLDAIGSRLAATIRWRHNGAVEERAFDGVIDCRGHQEHDWTRIDDPLVRNLVAEGIVRPHATGFGIDATRQGLVIDGRGHVQPNILAIGHPFRGVAWESSSIGEQLAQAIALAEQILPVESYEPIPA
ncbi:FAD/NAD(P)-binding protein [Kaistia dalseonensis]|uniref:NAD(P)/FAD-binding protein YdhS n=1 Tax=Kaistia dalseonensis TaxID=410840 RepID=A0ABU0H399_9HYPH|nr:FAD/NAD(P)-binding protein [Kaistia dalseonensis]MCX5493707.1 FAD/NAD(P)-binding protein [Kaistia dalseonensis]MDQ0436270.1 putative NAD(P)/FAD-binding protein YdhS [Kaistia dalseonensis]